MEIETISARLESFGYHFLNDADLMVVNFCVDKVTNHIRNFCNIPEVPIELQEVAVDMVCAEFLNAKYQTGQLNLSGLNLASGAVEQITEGDTTVKFASGSTDAARFTTMIDKLTHGRDGDLIRFRRMVW